MNATLPVHVVGAAILDGPRCLIAQRGPLMSMPGKWEFPGGKIEPGESAQEALARELQEELDIEATIGQWIGRGESIEDGRTIRLDVYAVVAECEGLRAKEHATLEWVRHEGIYERDWAAADIPVLPALRGLLAARDEEHQCPEPVALIAADWGKAVSKRAVYTAERRTDWIIEPRSSESGWTVKELLRLASEIRDRTGHAVLIGLDVSLGIPAALARRSKRNGFLDFVRWLETEDGLKLEAKTPKQWGPASPFFRIPKGKGGKSLFFEAAGGETTLLRQIELRTGGNPTFALSGIPGTVGSGTREVWRELAPLLRASQRVPNFYIWPFEGSLSELIKENAIVVAEIYPRAAYSLALADVLPAPPETIAKTKPDARAAALARLEAAKWLDETATTLPDLGAARKDEDEFDALMTTVAMVRAVVEKRPMSCSLVDPIAEGGILATGDIELPESPYHKPGSARRPKTRARAPGQRPEAPQPAQRLSRSEGKRCPVPGCRMVFASGRLGWDAHIGSVRRHRDWHPEVRDPERRKTLFKSEFGEWFRRGKP